jgi:hypothetical protein
VRSHYIEVDFPSTTLPYIYTFQSRRFIVKQVVFVIAFLLFSSTAHAVPILWSDNNNHYDFISTNITWHNAKAEAESLTYMGVSGHLVTITSASENAFIN